ncbi:unnamed protein product [Symbiodinium natans]|uniref:Ion transport domain-containing protein n=1 Tax=Symbiodinium natans TaxID=878477 RepID=A0A812IK00_9DINO|nr:unnamed protein product [Symbiodinium natans]
MPRPARPLKEEEPLGAVSPSTEDEVCGEDALGLPSLLARNHRTLMHRLDVQEALLRQVLEHGHAVPGADVPSTAVPVARQPLLRHTDHAHELEIRRRGPSIRSEGEEESVSKKISTKNSSIVLTSYTAEDLDRKESAAMLHAQHAMRKFASKVSRGVHHVQKHTDSCLKRVMQHQAFEGFFALVVISNAIFIGIDVHQSVSIEGPRPVSFQVVQYTYTVLFCMELIVRVAALKWRFFWSDDWMWSLLDVFIVVTSLWEAAVDIISLVQQGNGGLDTISGLTNMKSFRIIRLTRLLKTVQFVRIFRFVMALRMLVTSIISTLKALFWALILLGLIVYVFAVLFTQAVYDYNNDNNVTAIAAEDWASKDVQDYYAASFRYWGSLAKSMLSLFMSIAGGVSWEEAVTPLNRISPIWTFCFLFYIAFTYFAVLNVVTGVFCQSAIESAQNDHAMVVQSMIDNKTAHLTKIKALFSEIGAEESGVLTLGVFEEKIKSPAVRQYFEALGLDVWDAWSFFKLLDVDGGGAVEIEEFFLGDLDVSD